MANYHFEMKNICRGKGRSFTRTVSYITGEKLYDPYNETGCYHSRDDVEWSAIAVPAWAPLSYQDLQRLCNAVEGAESRYDARTAREFIGSLPNELPGEELVPIVTEFIDRNFIEQGLCAVAAIHTGLNRDDPSRNNPHAHILVSTRTVEQEGFSLKKDREHNKKKYLEIWREQWAKVQNRAYERNGLEIQVSHESLEVQGELERDPVPYMNRIEWQREQSGERTLAGDLRRTVRQRNLERELSRQLERELNMEMDR